MINVNDAEKELIVDMAVAYAHLLAISRNHTKQPYNYPSEDEDLCQWATMLNRMQTNSGIVLADPKKLSDLIEYTSQLIAIKKEREKSGTTD